MILAVLASGFFASTVWLTLAYARERHLRRLAEYRQASSAMRRLQTLRDLAEAQRRVGKAEALANALDAVCKRQAERDSARMMKVRGMS